LHYPEGCNNIQNRPRRESISRSMAVEVLSAIITHIKEDPIDCKQEVQLPWGPEKLASQKIRLSDRQGRSKLTQ